MNVTAIQMKGIKKSFGNVPVLKTVDFELRQGEIHTLLGENGAGKSTLVKILRGVYLADSGEITVAGKPVQINSPADAEANGIAMVFQEFSLIPTLTVAQNIFLTREGRNKFGLLDDRASERKAAALFKEMGVDIDPRATVAQLSTGYRQLTEIASALSEDARVLILDEPTASLTQTETLALFKLIRRLRDKGIAIIYISHRMQEIFQIADRITVLRDGNRIITEDVANLTIPQVIEYIIGRKIVIRQRYEAFKKTMSRDYPEIQIVAEEGIGGPDFANDAEKAASEMLTKHPDLAGIWAVWDVPAEGVITAAQNMNRQELVITTIDLGQNVAAEMARGGLVKGLSAQRPFDQGVTEAKLAGYGLLGKEAPPFVAMNALPVSQANLLKAWQTVYHGDPPPALSGLVALPQAAEPTTVEPAAALAPLADKIFSTGPNEEQPTPASQISLTEAEVEQIRQMHATAAIVLHYGNNDWADAQVAGLTTQFKKMGIEVIAVTDSGFNPEQQTADLKTVIAKKPNIIVSIPTDPVTMATTYLQAAEQGIKLVFMDIVPSGMRQGRDYVSVVSTDNYGHGMASAHMMANELGGRGKIGLIYLAADSADLTLRWRERAFDHDVEPLLEARNLTCEAMIRDVSFRLYAGEVLGLAGLMGSGRTELVEAIFGVNRIKSGELRVKGHKVTIRNPTDSMKARIALIPEDRRDQGLVLSHSVKDNFFMPLLNLGRLSKQNGLVDDKKGNQLVENYVKKLKVRVNSIFAPIRLLSGGNQQKIVIAKWLSTEPDILLMDEPTAGVDIGTKGEIVEMVRQLADEGKGIIIISSELQELLAISDRILILKNGQINRELDRREVQTEEKLHQLLQGA